MKGIYLLLIDVFRDINIKVGSLGLIHFNKGIYVYVGSAQNSLEARINRHLKDEKKIHWHIDYLLASKYSKVEKVYYKLSEKKEECRVAEFLSKRYKCVLGFGSSDCKCYSHLFKMNDTNYIKRLKFVEYN